MTQVSNFFGLSLWLLAGVPCRARWITRVASRPDRSPVSWGGLSQSGRWFVWWLWGQKDGQRGRIEVSSFLVVFFLPLAVVSFFFG